MEEKRKECEDDAGKDEIEKGFGIDSDRKVIKRTDCDKTDIFNWVKDQQEPFLSGVLHLVSLEWKGTPGAGQTVEEFVLKGTCAEGGIGALGEDKHSNEMNYEKNRQDYEVAHYTFRHWVEELGEHFQKYLGKIKIMTSCEGIYQGGGLHEVSMDKDGNVEKSDSRNNLCKEGEQEVEKKD